jgi:hypothetical protein
MPDRTTDAAKLLHPDRLIVVENWFEELGHHHQ